MVQFAKSQASSFEIGNRHDEFLMSMSDVLPSVFPIPPTALEFEISGYQISIEEIVTVIKVSV